ncbi:MAG: carbohydrate ABC transporter permease [Planctomycetota bacterium]
MSAPAKHALGFLKHAVLATLALLMLFPFLWMLSTAAKTDRETSEVPPRLFPSVSAENDGIWKGLSHRLDVTAGNFAAVWRKAPFGRYLLNTALVAVLVTLGTLATSILAGYAFGCLQFPAKRFLFILFLGTLMIPFEVTLLPNFLIVKQLKLLLGQEGLRTWWLPEFTALILPWVAGAFGVFLMRQHFAGLPRDYLDAARIDGCGTFAFLRHVGVPLTAPAVVTVAVFAFLGSWNAFTWPLLVTDDQRYYLVQIGLRSFLDSEVARYNFMMAAATITVLPTIILYLCAQRVFVQGVSGGIKE